MQSTSPIGVTQLVVNKDELSTKTAVMVAKLINDVYLQSKFYAEWDEPFISFEDYNRNIFNKEFESLKKIERAEFVGRAKGILEYIRILDIRLNPAIAYNLLRYLESYEIND